MKKASILLTSVFLVLALTAGVVTKSITFISAEDVIATTTSTAVKVNPQGGKYSTVVGYLKATNNSGTLPTLDAKIEYSPDCTNWFTIATFEQVTTGTGVLKNFHYTEATTGFFYCLRGVATLGGTEPNYDIEIKLYHD